MTTSEAGARGGEWRAIALCAAWVLSYFGARMVLEAEGLGTAARVAVALVPLLPFAVLLWMVIAGIRRLDELERRIQLEALAVAYPLAILLLMLLGLLQLAVPLSPDDWSYRHLWPFLFVFYFLGVVLARRRYT